MTLRRRIEILREEVLSLSEEEGQKIDPKQMLLALDRLLEDADRSFDFFWKKHQWRFELWKEIKLELTKAAITFGQGAIRSLILVNGAAAIAVMTFIGNFKAEKEEISSALPNALLSFALGVALAALLAGFAYIVQYLYVNSRGRTSKWAVFLHLVSLGFAAGSLGLFVCGLFLAYGAFQIAV